MSTLIRAKKLIKECQETQELYLDLGNCGIQDLDKLPELYECTHLEFLNFSNEYCKDTFGNRIKTTGNHGSSNSFLELPPRLSQLWRLKALIIDGRDWDLKITEIEVLSNLTQLEHLDLRSNGINSVSPLRRLIKLKSLFLYSNSIQSTNDLSALSNLQYLDIAKNEISSINALAKLTKLRHLDLSFNSLFEISPLKSLKHLHTLDISTTETLNINALKDLSGLANLNISNNFIHEIPESIVNHSSKIEFSSDIEIVGLNLSNNPIESPPIEILRQGKPSTLDWFKANKKKLNEIKVILIGDPEAGKTSILKRLKEDHFNENEVQTDGINIEDIDFGACKTFKEHYDLHDLTGHFWDFGGQEIMNSTHQFFLTNRSVYVLVLDARKDVKVSTQVREWVKRIKTTGGNSSIIVVANQIDINPGFGFDNEYELQKEFPQIKHFLKISCKEGVEIEMLKTHLAELIPKAELFNTEIDERWIKIKEKLQNDTKERHFLNEDRFLEVCNEFGLKKGEGQKNAITFLHDLGIVLNFEEVQAYDYYVLDPYWITYGVYQILTSAYAGENNGVVDMDKLDFIINEEEDKKQSYRSSNYKKILYTNNQRRFLVDILNQFKLSFYLPDRSQFIIPDLLDTKEPIDLTKVIRQDKNSIRFLYEYAYLPNSIVPHFMVETRQMHKEMWRTGCVLENEDCQALVTSYQNRISIWVIGEHKKKREFMSIIRHRINLINQDLSDKPNMLIPLPETAQHVDYIELIEREKDGQKLYTLYRPHKKAFTISVLLEGIANEKEVSNKDLLAELKRINAGITAIQEQLDTHFQYLINLPTNEEIKIGITDAIDEMNSTQIETVSHEFMHFIVEAFKIQQEGVDDKLDEIYRDLQKTDNFQLKLKLSTPLAQVLGTGLEGEFDIKNWSKDMYKKHELKIFKLFGWI